MNDNAIHPMNPADRNPNVDYLGHAVSREEFEEERLTKCSDFLDLPAIYGYDGELPFGKGCRFAISADPDTEYPQVGLHAHKEGIGGLFDLTPDAARELGKRLIAAADAVDEEVKEYNKNR